MKSSILYLSSGIFAAQLGGCIITPIENFCGDGIRQESEDEECDDGNNRNGDGCSSSCFVEEPVCGDGFLNAGEECDDGDTTSGDGCSANCEIEGFCGDGSLDAFEECDDNDNLNGDGCDAFCSIESVGTVSFQYVLLQLDVNNQIIASPSCNDIIDSNGALHDIGNVSFLLADDTNGNGIVDNAEILQETFGPCNQDDVDNDGVLELDELGVFQELMFANDFDLFAIEFLDTSNNSVLWETFDVNEDAERFSFGAGVGFSIAPNNITTVPFQGDNAQLAQELQVFIGF
jgi:cysteine-rich repeat protein